MFFLCFRLLLKEAPKTQKTYVFLVYISVTFILATISIVTTSLTTQHTYVDDAHSLGSLTADTAHDFTSDLEHMNDITSLISTACRDSLLVSSGASNCGAWSDDSAKC